MPDRILFWHRRDLRITDNIGLAEALSLSPNIIGVFCLDPNLLERDDIAPARVTYMIGSLQALQDKYRRAGSDLLILHNEPIKALPAIVAALEVNAVFWNRDVEAYSRERDRTVAAALRQAGVEVNAFWDQLLHAPKEVFTGSRQPYTVYTPFWRNWSSKPKALPVASLTNATGLTPEEHQRATIAGAIALPTASDLGFKWDTPLLLEPGEQAAQEQLEAFCQQAIQSYDEQRNFPGNPQGTSHLSAALKFGVIGIRTVWQRTLDAFEQTRSDETRTAIRTWQQELAWREFYQHVMFFFPELAEGPYRQPFKDFPWDNDETQFQAWCAGRTGYPIVDAAMRQLNELGWMHNRCRMIVASFLTKDLIIDWRWGEKYFMQKLYDGDLSANNGGWQWSASSGMDPKPIRIFNPASQAQKYDPDAEYIREWLPELRSLDTELLISGKIPQSDCDRLNYPAPIVDHKKQQQIFKQRYSQQKTGNS